MVAGLSGSRHGSIFQGKNLLNVIIIVEKFAVNRTLFIEIAAVGRDESLDPSQHGA